MNRDMHYKELNVQRFQCYDEQVNIRLFNAAVQLAIATTDAAKQIATTNVMLNHQIWYEKLNDPGFFDAYGIRYFGELLERFEEKIGAETRNLRALALAMAYTSPILTDAMFIADQRFVFLEKVRHAAANDVYLTGALYLLADDVERSVLCDSLLQHVYTKLEEAIFVLSMLKGDASDFDQLRPRIVQMLASKQLPIAQNSGAYGWLLAVYRNEIKGCRKADNVLLKAFLALTDSYVREKHVAYRILAAAGYSHAEITFANLLFNREPHLRPCAMPENSIPAEKLATAFVLTTLNGNTLPSDTAFEHIRWLLQYYSRFKIKYQGFQGLWAAVKDELNPVLPEIVIWMIRNIGEEFPYRFDVMDDKWDVLAAELEPEKYHALFRMQLLADRTRPRETVRQMLERYKTLTGAEYAEVFESYSYVEADVFSLLVDLGIIDLWDYFERHKGEVVDHWQCKCIHYVLNKVKSIEDRSAYVFWKRFFHVYSIKSIAGFWPSHRFHEPFARRTSSYHLGFHLQYRRDFLTREENRQLYEWIDASFFSMDPENYTLFALTFLHDDSTYELFDKSEVRPVFDALQKTNPDDSRIRSLKARFLSPAELVADKAAEEAKLLVEKQRAADAELEQVRAKLDEKFNGTYNSLVDALVDYRYWAQKRRRCAQLILGMLPRLSAEHRDLPCEELAALLRLYGTLAEEGFTTVEEILNTLQDVRIRKSDMQEADVQC